MQRLKVGDRVRVVRTNRLRQAGEVGIVIATNFEGESAYRESFDQYIVGFATPDDNSDDLAEWILPYSHFEYESGDIVPVEEP